MPPSTLQKNIAAQFIAITGAKERDAHKVLKSVNYKLDQACDCFFAQNGAGPQAKEKDALSKLFESYRGSTDEEDMTSVEGTMKYLVDLGVDMENAEMLVPLEIVQAPALGEMTKEGFIGGWSAAGQDTVAKQRTYLKDQLNQLNRNHALFKRVYRHTFICAKEKSQKALPLENALVYWDLLFSPPGKPWTTASTDWKALWLEFLKAKWTKSVNKDMWNQTLEFHLKTMEDETLSFWTEDSAWPGVIDEFVFFAKEKRGDIPENMEMDD